MIASYRLEFSSCISALLYETLLGLGRCNQPASDRRELSGFLAMKIPVFISCPTSLSPSHEAARTLIIRQLDDNGLEARALGRSDYPAELPLREVLLIARSLLGWNNSGFRAVPRERWVEKARNRCRRARQHINSISDCLEPFGVRHSFRASSPDPVFREDGITGRIFDTGVSDVFIHPMPPLHIKGAAKDALRQVFQRWAGRVRAQYYKDKRG